MWPRVGHTDRQLEYGEWPRVGHTDRQLEYGEWPPVGTHRQTVRVW